MGDDYSKIAPAFVKACAALQAATKNSRNAHRGNSYADLESVQTAARDALAPNGLAWFQEVVREDRRIGVHTRIIHTAGQILDCGRCLITVPGNSRNLAHAESAALSYARRYGLAAAVGIHQADPDASPVDTPAPKRAPAKPKPKPKAPPKAAKPDPDLEALGLTVEQVDRWLSTKGAAWANLTPTRKKNALKWVADNADEVRGK